MRKQYVVRLSKQERKELQALTRRGHLSARKLLHAQVLLKVDQAKQGPAWTDAQVAEFLAVGTSMIEQVRKRFCQEGLQAAISRRPQPERPESRCLDGAGQAHLVALACSKVPDGYEHWTLQLLADRMVELRYAEHVSYETVRQTLKKPDQALAEGAMVHSAQGIGGVCLADGGRAGCLPAAVQPQGADGLSG